MEKMLNGGFKPADLDDFEYKINLDDGMIEITSDLTEEDDASEEVEIAVEETAPIVDEGEDLLLAEIDAFRNKAAQLQQLINAKERNAAELEVLVKEKEEENQELQNALYKKREEANAIVTDVETQVDRMMASLRSSMDQLEVDVKTIINNNDEVSAAHLQRFNDSVAELSQAVATMNAEISEKTHSESVHLYRLLQDTMKENDKSDALANKANTHYKSLKGFATTITVFTILGFACSVASLLIALGIIRF